MENLVINKEFDWAEQLESTVVSSLATTFGLDFLLFEDKKGGEVDTVHNVRQGTWATEEEKKRYDNREDYDSVVFHQHKNYVKNNKEISRKKKAGELEDAFLGDVVSANAKIDQDHIVSANEIHNDAGRVLAELNGEDLANRDENLVPISSSLNRSKQDKSMSEFISKLGEKIANKNQELEKFKNHLNQLENETPRNQHKIDEVQKKIINAEKYIEDHQKLKDDPSKALEADKKVRELLDREINWAYYTSSKFFKNTAMAAGKAGLKLGIRQALGLVLAEIWFELREQIPDIYQKCKNKFEMQHFLKSIQQTLKGIWERIKERFKDLLCSFRDGALAGTLSSLNTTLLNIFLTTEKLIGKMIREMWNSIVGVIKLVFFNPNRLAMGDLLKAAMRLLGLGVSTLVGTYIHTHLQPLLNFPLGAELASFVSAVVTGMLNLGFVYFLEHSELTNKVWTFLNQFKPKLSIEQSIDYMREVNAELDRYLCELSKIEFNMNPLELRAFSESLITPNSELEFILESEIKRRGIELPFESGNPESVRRWLIKKCSKKK